jgi:hypothetical protein
VISWDSTPGPRGSAVTSYEIKFKQSDNTLTANASCDGTLNFLNRECTVPMTVFVAAPYSLTLGTTIVATVSAINSIGTSDPSPVNSSGVVIQTTPTKPPTAPANGTSTSNTQIHVTWNNLVSPDNGGSIITNYEVFINDGQGGTVYTSIYSGTGTSTIYSTSIVQMRTYLVKYRGDNIHGTGIESDTTGILAATVPTKIATPVSTEMAGKNVVFQWAVSPSANGSPVTAYRIKFKKSNGSYIEETANCNGETQSIKDSRSCTVPMTIFTGVTFSLSLGDLIVAIVEAKNSIGYSPESDVNTTGVLAQTVPQSPLLPPSKGANSSNTQIEVEWNQLLGSFTGGSSIIQYDLLWDAANSGLASADFISIFKGDLLSYVKSDSIVSGSTYRFKYAGENVHGEGASSGIVSILAADVPG